MTTISPPDDSLISFDDPYAALSMAMLQNAVQEICCYLNKSITKRRIIKDFGYIENPLAELRWFINHPHGAELVLDQANLGHVIHEYRKKALLLLEQVEWQAKPASRVISPATKRCVQPKDIQPIKTTPYTFNPCGRHVKLPRHIKPQRRNTSNGNQLNFFHRLFPVYDYFPFYNDCISCPPLGHISETDSTDSDSNASSRFQHPELFDQFSSSTTAEVLP